MKAIVKSVQFKKEYESRYGTLYGFKVVYEVNGKQKEGFYSSKKRDQDNFVEGKDAELIEEIQKGNKGEWIKIKPAKGFVNSNFGRALKREQSKYSGFAMAYAKDLVVAGIIKIDQMYSEAQCMVDWMVETDKNIES